MRHLAAAAWIVVSSSAYAQNAPVAGRRGQAVAVQVEKGPAIDGSFKDPLWAKAGVLALGAATSQEPGRYTTEARVLFDSKNIYVGAWCQENQVPVARVFDVFRAAEEAGEDYKKLMTAKRGPEPGWPEGYPGWPMYPSFELGYTRRLIVIKETFDRVLFALLDRPE